MNKFLIVALALLVVGAQAEADFVDYLNQVSGWEATHYEQFEGLNDEEFAARYLGANFMDINNLPEGVTIQGDEDITADIPANFDSSKQWPGCVHAIRDQMKCGSCWAFAASEVLSDRFCISSNKGINVVLSPQYLVSCDHIDHGCSGGWPAISWKFIEGNGLVTDACLPYQSGDGIERPDCKDFKACADGSSLKKYFAKKSSTTLLTKPAIIQANILKFGPVEAAFTVYADFKQYKGGIYKHVSGSILGGHAVKIVGWGNENGTNYWIAANSWTEKWGENGFFRIAFGECGFDKQCIAGEADLTKATQSEFLSYW